jgi:hypothetical protein
MNPNSIHLKRSMTRRQENRLLERSSVCCELLREKEEINKLKWLESEKHGQDIGYERALLLWARRHRRAWRNRHGTLRREA